MRIFQKPQGTSVHKSLHAGSRQSREMAINKQTVVKRPRSNRTGSTNPGNLETLISRDRGNAALNKNDCKSEMPLLPELLTETQVAMTFNVSINTLRYWRHCGDGPNYVKMGRLVRYHAAELESYVQRKTCVSKARATAEENRVAH